MDSPRIFGTFLRTGVVMSILLVSSWWLLGRSAFEKIATTLAMPCGVMWYGLICATIICWTCTQRRVAWLMTGVLLAYSTIGNGFLANAMTRSLEEPYYTASPLEESPFDVVIVLGGGASGGQTRRVQGNYSGDRVILAAQLYHAGLAPKIVCTGKRIASISSADLNPADQSADVLVKLGVPEDTITKIGGRTTAEEMVVLKDEFGADNRRIGLLTSAWHMPRAVRLARRSGLSPIPLPADFQSSRPATRPAGEVILMCIPQADAYFSIARMAKEYLGMAVGR